MAARSTLSKGLLAAAIAAAFAVLMALGTWQLERLAWKEALIEAASARPSLAAVAAPGPEAWPALDIAEWEYRPVTLTGRFGEDEALYFITLSDARGPLSGTGYFVVAPFFAHGGWTVAVNRGFVTEPMIQPGGALEAARPPTGEVTITGIVRPDDPSNFLQPLPDPGGRTFLARDIQAMNELVFGSDAPLAPYQIDLAPLQGPAGGVPQAGEWRIAFTNNHLGYAITWYGIGVALVGVVGFSVLRRKKPKS